MRETKNQTISRLKREVTKLKEESKLLRSQLRILHKDSRSESIDREKLHTNEVTILQTEISKWKEEQDRERRDLEKTLEETRLECKQFQETVHKLVREEELEKEKNREKEREKEREEKRRMERERLELEKKEKLEEDASRLDYFTNGSYCWRRNYFIDSHSLVLNINPHTGELLNITGWVTICKLIQDEPYYQQRLDEVNTYLENHDYELVETKKFIHSVGIDIYEKLYPNFQFEEYSI